MQSGGKRFFRRLALVCMLAIGLFVLAVYGYTMRAISSPAAAAPGAARSGVTEPPQQQAGVDIAAQKKPTPTPKKPTPTPRGSSIDDEYFGLAQRISPAPGQGLFLVSGSLPGGGPTSYVMDFSAGIQLHVTLTSRPPGSANFVVTGVSDREVYKPLSDSAQEWCLMVPTSQDYRITAISIVPADYELEIAMTSPTLAAVLTPSPNSTTFPTLTPTTTPDPSSTSRSGMTCD